VGNIGTSNGGETLMKTTGHNRYQMMSLLSLFLMLLLATAHAQTYTVIHSFSGGADGATPRSGLTPDGAGNFYGTTYNGGYQGSNCGYSGCGVVYRLSKKNGAWVPTNLHSFTGGSDGAWPQSRVVLGPDGALYGTTFGGNGSSCSNNGCGTVFRLTPPSSPCHAVSCPWIEKILYSFSGADGALPAGGDLVFDHSGNIYGTTSSGGANNFGAVFKVTHSGGHWTESVVYSFTGGDDGGTPLGGLIFDSAGNLWGTTSLGGLNSPPDIVGPGTLFELTPNGTGWAYTTIYEFRGNDDGGIPQASLALSSDGTMYGTASTGGSGLCAYNTYYTGCGTIFTVAQQSLAYYFSNFPVASESPGLSGPVAPVTLDADQNMYGTAFGAGRFASGSVYKITFWNRSYSSLHDFTGRTDGASPASNVIIDSNGNMFGTAGGGGSPICSIQGGCGVIWEITQ
jgi:uncharacterized repeat protein (TIGR03803 family)